MDYRALVVLAGVGIVVLAWLLLRFGRTIAKAALVAAGLALAVIVALAVLNQATASRQAAQAATVAATGQTVSSAGNTVALVVGALCVGTLGTVTAGALAVAGVLYYRQRLEEQRRTALPRRRRRELQEPTSQPIVWVADVQDQGAVDLSQVDPSEWGW
jgi:hypothetical protein